MDSHHSSSNSRCRLAWEKRRWNEPTQSCWPPNIMGTKSSRRAFLKGTAVAGAAYIAGSPTLEGSMPISVIAVGAGAFGSWSALQLAQPGAKVILLDAWGPGNSPASSRGETRTIRATYGPPHGLHAKMVARAYSVPPKILQLVLSNIVFPCKLTIAGLTVTF
jgi:hypothetical protein